MNNKNRSQPTSLMDKNVLITEPKKVANILNNYFSSFAMELQETIHENGEVFNMYLNNGNEFNLF